MLKFSWREFAAVLVPNCYYNKLPQTRGLKQHVRFLQFWRLKSKMGPMRLKSRYDGAAVLLEAPVENAYLTISASRGCPHFLTHDSMLYCQGHQYSSIRSLFLWPLLPLSHLFLILALRHFLLRKFCLHWDYLGDPG